MSQASVHPIQSNFIWLKTIISANSCACSMIQWPMSKRLWDLPRKRWLAHGSRTLLEMLAGFVSRFSFLSTAQFDTARQMGRQLSKNVGPFWLPFKPIQRGSLIKKGNTPMWIPTCYHFSRMACQVYLLGPGRKEHSGGCGRDIRLKPMR